MKHLLAFMAATAMTLAPGLAAAQDTTGTTQTTQASEVPPAPQTSTAPVQQVVVVEQGSAEQRALAPQAESRTRARVGLVIGGAVMLGVSWIVHAALVSPFAGWSLNYGDDPEWKDFRIFGAIPVVGPWMQLAVKPTAAFEDSWATYLVVDGLLQAAGLTMLILGLTLRKEVGGYADNGPSFTIGPMAGQNGAGLMAAGRF